MSVQIPPGSPPTRNLNKFQCFRLIFSNFCLRDVSENRCVPKTITSDDVPKRSIRRFCQTWKHALTSNQSKQMGAMDLHPCLVGP
jgi:hypothetical protein